MPSKHQNTAESAENHDSNTKEPTATRSETKDDENRKKKEKNRAHRKDSSTMVRSSETHHTTVLDVYIVVALIWI
jgi:hypothetical protein